MIRTLLRRARRRSQRPLRLRARPQVELLEDRCVLHSLSLSPLVPVSGTSPFLDFPIVVSDLDFGQSTEGEPYLTTKPFPNPTSAPYHGGKGRPGGVVPYKIGMRNTTVSDIAFTGVGLAVAPTNPILGGALLPWAGGKVVETGVNSVFKNAHGRNPGLGGVGSSPFVMSAPRLSGPQPSWRLRW